MLITLKQKEIEAALRMLITASGVSLAGKTVDITFTAGRKEAGLSAEVSIETDGSTALELPVQAAVITPVDVAAAAVSDVLSTATPAAVVADPAPAEGAVPVTDTCAPASLFN